MSTDALTEHESDHARGQCGCPCLWMVEEERASEVGERCGFSFGTPDWVCGRAPDHPFHDHAVSKPHDPSEQCHTFVPTPRPDALTAGGRFLAEVERDLRERFPLTVAAIERAARERYRHGWCCDFDFDNGTYRATPECIGRTRDADAVERELAALRAIVARYKVPLPLLRAAIENVRPYAGFHDDVRVITAADAFADILAALAKEEGS